MKKVSLERNTQIHFVMARLYLKLFSIVNDSGIDDVRHYPTISGLILDRNVIRGKVREKLNGNKIS